MQLATISYDSRQTLKAFATRHNITFPLLSDPQSEIIKRYGLLNTAVQPDSRTFGIPFPGTFILDADGKVVGRFFEDTYQVRNTASSIVAKIGRGREGRSSARLTTQHLDMNAYVSDAVVAPGTRFSLVFDIAPKARMHVYAPGQPSYRAVGVKIEPDAAVVVQRAIYPKAEEYLFKPLNERVLVYQKPFRLIQDLSIALTPEVRALAKQPNAAVTIRGTLEYQACDDRLCFNPQSIPLAWTVQLRPLEP